MSVSRDVKVCKIRNDGGYKAIFTYVVDNNDVSEEMKREYKQNCHDFDRTAAMFNKAAETVSDIDKRKLSKSIDIDRGYLYDTIEKVNDFLIDFDMNSASARFFDTLFRSDDPSEYLYNIAYLKNRDCEVLEERFGSPEFSQIMSQLDAIRKRYNREPINKRLIIYYGEPGTGKTTQAIEKYDCPVIVCNESMSPDELLNDFTFIDGKPAYVHSALYAAMIKGTPIILDEINKLPLSSLYFLQALTDNKKTIQSREKINIADGFMIIGTMNVAIDKNFYTLPEALLDRAAEIKKFDTNINKILNVLYEN